MTPRVAPSLKELELESSVAIATHQFQQIRPKMDYLDNPKNLNLELIGNPGFYLVKISLGLSNPDFVVA